MDYGVGGDNNGKWGKQLTVLVMELVNTTRAADRRPIDPPPVVQLRVIDKSVSRSSSPDEQCVSFFRYSSLSLSLSLSLPHSLPLAPSPSLSPSLSHSLPLAPSLSLGGLLIGFLILFLFFYIQNSP